ncbi:MAG TPA: hypothetical protein VGD72_07105 [Mycobacteriales bacterium]
MDEPLHPAVAGHARRQHGVFTWRQALTGCTPDEIRARADAGRRQRVLRGTCAARTVALDDTTVLAALLVAAWGRLGPVVHQGAVEPGAADPAGARPVSERPVSDRPVSDRPVSERPVPGRLDPVGWRVLVVGGSATHPQPERLGALLGPTLELLRAG